MDQEQQNPQPPSGAAIPPAPQFSQPQPQTAPLQPNQPPVYNAPAAPVPEMPKKKLSKKWKIALIVAAVLVIVFVAITYFVTQATNAPAMVSQQFITDLQNNNATDAYSLTAPEFRSATSSTAFTAFASQENQFLPKSSPQVTSRQINSSSGTTTATIVMSIKSSSGTGYTATVQLAKENGKWLILNADIK